MSKICVYAQSSDGCVMCNLVQCALLEYYASEIPGITSTLHSDCDFASLFVASCAEQTDLSRSSTNRSDPHTSTRQKACAI